MTEAEFQAMLSRASAKKAEAQERAQALARRRETLLTKAIQSNRVRVDFVEVDGELSRDHFDSSMNKLMRRNAYELPDDGQD